MPLQVESEDKVTGIGYYRTGVWSARDLLEQIGETEGIYLERYQPEHSRYDDGQTYKVTITVEAV